MNLLGPIFFGLLGTALAGFLLLVFLRAVFGQFRFSLDSIRFKRAAQRMEQIDQLIDTGKMVDAVVLLKQAVIYDLFRNRDSLPLLRDHHQGVLSRVVVIAEETEGSTTNIGRVEQLFQQRLELLRLLIKAQETFAQRAERRGSAGKSTPAWSRVEQKNKLGEIRAELQHNQQTLQKELTELFSAIQAPASTRITYH